ncbi:MAG: aminotransferase class IV [Acidobacteria bacterium]|nr:aminotransferase class IV [Acidobacteriota bacterium]
MGFFASVNGLISPAEEARVSVLDNGFTFGDSVYETLRTYGGRPFHLDRHFARLRNSARRIAVDLPQADGRLAEWLDALLARAGNPESYIRMIVTRGVGEISYRFERVKGPTVVMVVKPYEPLPESHYAEGIAVALVSVRRNAPEALDPAIKSCNLLNNVLAVREAQARGALEAILLNGRGDVAEGASSNVFAVKHGVVLTPPLEAGILAGITRDVILEQGAAWGVVVREETLRVPDLLSADEAFVTSTLKEAAPIRTIDGRPVGAGRPGPVTLKILQAFREYAPRHSR